MTTYLADYAHFTNKHNMDEAVMQHVSANLNELNKTDRVVLDIIRRYSVKHGAAHLKHETIEKAVGKSNGTVRRILRKLEQLDIIERVRFIRPVMSGLGANIYAVKPFQEKPKVIAPDPVETPTIVNVRPEVPSPEPISTESVVDNHEQVPTTLFGRMKSILSSTIGEDSLARKIYGVYRQQSGRMLKLPIYAEEGALFEDLAIQALHISVQATKRKAIRNMPGYYMGVLRELIDKALFSDTYMHFDEQPTFFFINQQGERCYS
ncbi:helix-turn-helix domain-containing protein [Sporosarcina sp. NPDC096371]|uniref:helix-turn-helix domain-containing protein n=1 Tax=Sporosarcina sp. NPDC096371 TaxID=3364530 RepID=UPI003812EAE5